MSPQIESGNVYLPDPAVAPWVTGFIEECAQFPNGAYDDQVDAMSQAPMRLLHPGYVELPPLGSLVRENPFRVQ